MPPASLIVVYRLVVASRCSFRVAFRQAFVCNRDLIYVAVSVIRLNERGLRQQACCL